MNNNENVQKNECSCNTENGKKIVEMLETERKRIVSELHDTSLQNIAHFVHMIELASLYIDKDPVRAKMELNSVSKGLHNVIEDIRSTIFNLRPMTFDDLGLKASMQGETYIQPSLVPALNSRLVSRDIDKEKINSLTKRELEVLIEVANGMFNKEIATSLNISERTVKNHISNIFKKIDVSDRTQAAVFAIKNDLIKLY